MSQVNQTYPIYEDGVFRSKAFLSWAAESGIAWPWTRNTQGRPYRPYDDDTLELLECRHPFIATVRQTRKTLNAFSRRSRFVIDGKVGKHYFSTSVFRSITGRNQPANSGFIFGAPNG